MGGLKCHRILSQTLQLTSAVREAIISCSTLGAGTSNHIRFAVTLASKLITIEVGGTLEVTLTVEGTIVVVGGEREGSIAAETMGILTEMMK